MVGLNSRRAGTNTLIVGTCGGEHNATNTTLQELAKQLATLHIFVTDGEEETVTYGLIDILVVDNVEAVAGENLTYTLSAQRILAHLVAVVVDTLSSLVSLMTCLMKNMKLS